MTRDEALNLLRAGKEGITNWNRLRSQAEVIPSLGGAKLDGCDLRDCNLLRVDLTDADLRGAWLQKAVLQEAILIDCDLSDALVDVATKFHEAQVKGCIIDRHALESLDGYGGLTAGQRMDMKIKDGVAALRASYSGFWQWVHLISLAVFVFPYAYFVFGLWATARFDLRSGHVEITMLEALVRFIITGGENWRADDWHLNFWPFVFFIQALCYNALRGFLLWKTKSLELAQDASGLPVRFSLTGGWNVVYWVAKIWFLLNLVCVSLNTLHFFQQKIALDEPPVAAQPAAPGLTVSDIPLKAPGARRRFWDTEKAGPRCLIAV